AVAQAVRATVDALGDSDKIIAVGKIVEVASGPEIKNSTCSPRPRRHQFGLQLEVRRIGAVLPYPHREGAIICAAGQLDRATALEAFAVTWLCIAEIRAAFICGSAGVFFHRAKAIALVGKLREEMNDAKRIRHL